MREKASINGAQQMEIMEATKFELPPLTPTDNSWYSNSSEEYSYTDGFHETCRQQSVNSSLRSPRSLPVNSAFTAYVQSDPKLGLDFFYGGHTLHKRCFRFLGLIREKGEAGSQISSVTSPAANGENERQKSRIDIRNKTAVEHMIAERNRRSRMKQHFANLYSLLPKQSKRDKHSILTNATSYLRELKVRLADLEHENQNLLKLIPENALEKGGGSSRIESHQKQLNLESKLYFHSDEVALEQAEENSRQVKMSIRAQRDLIRCPTSLVSKLLELLSAEESQLVSIHSPTEALWFHATLLIEPKGKEWNASKWKDFGETVRRFVASNYHSQMNSETYFH